MSDRVTNLIRMYAKYCAAGKRVQAQRTLDRIREVGGVEGVEGALLLAAAEAQERK